jgi:hypothetical protein
MKSGQDHFKIGVANAYPILAENGRAVCHESRMLWRKPSLVDAMDSAAWGKTLDHTVLEIPKIALDIALDNRQNICFGGLVMTISRILGLMPNLIKYQVSEFKI